MDDMIYRKDAIEVADAVWSVTGDKNVAKVWDQIQDLPSAQPECKTGRWIPLQLSIAYPPYQCSCCFKNAPMIETGCLMNRHLEALLTHFCPNCGADMRGKGEK